MLGFLLFQVWLKSIRVGQIPVRKGIIISYMAKDNLRKIFVKAQKIKPEFLWYTSVRVNPYVDTVGPPRGGDLSGGRGSPEGSKRGSVS